MTLDSAHFTSSSDRLKIRAPAPLRVPAVVEHVADVERARLVLPQPGLEGEAVDDVGPGLSDDHDRCAVAGQLASSTGQARTCRALPVRSRSGVRNSPRAVRPNRCTSD